MHIGLLSPKHELSLQLKRKQIPVPALLFLPPTVTLFNGAPGGPKQFSKFVNCHFFLISLAQSQVTMSAINICDFQDPGGPKMAQNYCDNP